MMRTRCCGAFREGDVGTLAAACGWVQARRDMGGVIFLDLVDREGALQVVCDAARLSAEAFRLAETVRPQSVLRAEGFIRLRDAQTRNDRIPTGTVELRADRLTLLSGADPLPFPLEGADAVREELRLAYRFLDLRRPKVQQALRFRHALQQAVEAYLAGEGFLSVETPILTKSTPEGARDYLVPSRVHPGAFYALPQSPQIFKQLLMVGGMDRYYQVARCFRDEDLRADRQPEFTQVDLEMSFVEQEDVLALLEGLLRSTFEAAMGYPLQAPIPRIPWQEAMDRYGSDKPDLRFGLPIVEVTDLMAQSTFGVFQRAVTSGGVVRAINAKGCAELPRSAIDALGEQAVQFGAKGMAWIGIRPDGSLNSILTKYIDEGLMQRLFARMEAQPGDLILFGADSLAVVRASLGRLRLRLGDLLDLRPKDRFAFLFVTDFPQFELCPEEGRYVAMHHPFTMPNPEDLAYLESDPGRVRALAYDAVLNGVELGSGSIRIHDAALQQRMLAALGFSEEEAIGRFGFLLRAFRYGTPPHGGFAFGLDRLAMLLLGADSLREVIAFPKLRDGSCPLTGAPAAVDAAQLAALSFAPEGQRAAAKNSPPRVDAERIARLSRLSLSGEERRSLPGQLEEILHFADALGAVDTQGVPELALPGRRVNVYREDIPAASLPRQDALAAAPEAQDGFIVVPRTVEGEEA